MQEDKSIIVAERNARSSAVGSAPRSGRGGRAFESPLLDKIACNITLSHVTNFIKIEGELRDGTEVITE